MTKIFLIAIIFIPFSLWGNFYKNQLEGWFAYKEAVKEEEKQDEPDDKKIKQKKTTVEIPKNLQELSAKEFEALITEAKEIATVHPTKDNVRKLIILNNYVQDRADALSNTWTEVMLENPELDISINIGKSKFAKNAFGAASKEEKENFFNRYEKYLTIVLFYDSTKKEITQAQDTIFEIIKYTNTNLKQLKIDTRNPSVENLLNTLKINKDLTPDIWLMVDINKSQKWKRLSIGLSTKERIMDQLYVMGKQIIEETNK
ncbi:MAG: conjugal transfer protein TraF [Arcobacteraceae bacterium]|jgi:hypothetical protein